MNKNIFVYPIVPKRLSATQNPYMDDLIRSLENNGWNVINKLDDRRHGVFSIFNYFFSTDIYYFNWIENLPQKKLGLIQTILFLIQLFLIKVSGKKVIWTLHNLNSHYAESILYRLVQSLMLKFSNIIIIHSKETFNFLAKRGVDESKVLYFFHPFNDNISKNSAGAPESKKIIYDVLIWGAMNPYKGVLELVEYFKQNAFQYRIHIAGKFKDDKFYEKVKEQLTDYITINNAFIPDEEVIALHHQSRYILFPYNGSSVLNSGALAFSLPLKAPIIGPKIGAFKELGDLKLINTFDKYSDLIQLLEHDSKLVTQDIDDFISANSWNNFGKQLSGRI
jgi:glycosyltransferase involved in cell wall biosynthesis